MPGNFHGIIFVREKHSDKKVSRNSTICKRECFAPIYTTLQCLNRDYQHETTQFHQTLTIMKYDPEKHQRISIRLKEFDYSEAGYYFITIFTYRRESIFGGIQNDNVTLNPFGRIISNKWNQIPEHFENVQLDEYIIMPGNFHGIIFVREKHSDKELSKIPPYAKKNASPIYTLHYKTGIATQAHGSKADAISSKLNN